MVDNNCVPCISPTSKNGSSEPNSRSFAALLGRPSALDGSTIVIEIPPGNDVIEYIINFACSNEVSLNVESGSGIVSDIHVRHPGPLYGQDMIYHGLHKMISLRGSYMNFQFPPSSSFANNPPMNKFMIRLSGSQGVVYDRIVVGKVMAAGPVAVNASMFKISEYYKAPNFDRNLLIVEDEENSSSFSDHDSSGFEVNTNNA